jgi:hypothetical protein
MKYFGGEPLLPRDIIIGPHRTDYEAKFPRMLAAPLVSHIASSPTG